MTYENQIKDPILFELIQNYAGDVMRNTLALASLCEQKHDTNSRNKLEEYVIRLEDQIKELEASNELHRGLNRKIAEAYGLDFPDNWADLPEKIKALKKSVDELNEEKYQLSDILNGFCHSNINRWVSVKDRQPDRPGEYLAYVEGNGETLFDVCDFTNRQIWVIGSNMAFDDERYEVSHWMRLPMAPKSK